jgi:hypothetical protein
MTTTAGSTAARRDTAASRRAGPMLTGRQADSARRRKRVIAVLNRANAHGEEISVSAIAAQPGSTAPSCTVTATCSHKSTPSRRPRQRPAPPARWSPGPRCKPTYSPPRNAPSAWPRTSGSSNTACPRHSANKHGVNPGARRL